jgi:small-conductance mechanosensitive channel
MLLASWKSTAGLLLFLMLSVSAGQAQSESESWFEVETVNDGMGAVPDGVERETPRDTVDSFLSLTRAGAYSDAAHTLNLNGLDAGDRRGEGARLARMLAEVIERRVIINWSDIPGRPDALNASLPENHPFAGKQRRSLKLAELPTESRPVSIRLDRLKPANGNAIWLFSRQTVKDIPRLHAQFGPGWFERQLPHAMTREIVPNVRFWELIVFPLLLLMAVGLYILLNKAIGSASRRASVGWVNRASEKTRAPLAIGITALAVQYAAQTLFTFSSLITTVLSPLLAAIIIFSITFAVLKAIDATLEVVTDRYVGEIDSKHESERRHLYTNIYALRRFVLLAAFTIGFLLLVLNLNLFDNIGLSLLASAGVATVILGIAGQTVLGNILASLQIAIAKPIRIGDAVLYDDRWAHVESIYYTYITLRCWDERRLIVPVKHFISQPFENWTIVDAKSTRTFDMELDLTAEPAVLREVFEDIARNDEDVMAGEMLMVAEHEYHQSTQTVRFYATADNPTDAWLMHVRLSEEMGNWVRENRPEWWPRLRLHQDDKVKTGRKP